MKNKSLAVLLALFFGGFGFHKFYLGQTGKGVLYLLFCWTMIPAILSIIDIIKYLMMDNKSWKKYNKSLQRG